MARTAGTPNRKTIERSGFHCFRCADNYAKQEQGFYISQSDLYRFNGRRFSVCKKCIDAIFTSYMKAFANDVRAATERLCRLLNIYYSDVIVQKAQADRAASQSYIEKYIHLSNMKPFLEKTYEDTIAENKDDGFKNASQQGKDNADIVSQAEEIFGKGHDLAVYPVLLDLYSGFIEMAGESVDIDTEKTAKILALMENQIQIAAKSGAKELSTLTREYRAILGDFKDSIAGKSGADEDTNLGIWIRDIEKYTPAEYYKDKKLFADMDSIGEYISRFLRRPLANLLSKDKKIMDEEFNISDDDVRGDDLDA